MKQTKPRLTNVVMRGLRHVLNGSRATTVLLSGLDEWACGVSPVEINEVSRAIEWIAQMEKHRKGKGELSC